MSVSRPTHPLRRRRPRRPYDISEHLTEASRSISRPIRYFPPPPSSLTLKFAFSSGLVTRMTGERSDPAAWNLAGGGGWRRVAAGGGDWETDATRFTDFETQSAPVLLLTSLTCCVPPEGVLFSFCQLRLTLTGHGRLIKSEKSLTRSIRQSHKPFSLFLSLSLSPSLSLSSASPWNHHFNPSICR